MRLMLLLVGILLLSPAFAQENDQRVMVLIQQGDLAKQSHENVKALELYQQALAIDKTNLQALFKTGYQLSRVGWLEEKKGNKDLAIQYYQKKKAIADILYALYPNSFEANFLKAAAAARLAKFDNAKGRVHASWDIQKYGEVAYSINPSHPDVLHMMAWFNFELSKPTWLERSAAKMFFGGLPQGASIEKAIDLMERTLATDPRYKVFLFDLAKFYAYNGKEAKALLLLDKLDSLPQERPEDEYYYRDSKELRATID